MFGGLSIELSCVVLLLHPTIVKSNITIINGDFMSVYIPESRGVLLILVYRITFDYTDLYNSNIHKIYRPRTINFCRIGRIESARSDVSIFQKHTQVNNLQHVAGVFSFFAVG